MKDRLPRILEIKLELLPQARLDVAEGDSNGVSMATLSGDFRDIGVAEFVISGNVVKFRENLSEAAKLRLRLFERSANGEPIAASFLAMLTYQQLFDALAAFDFITADRLAGFMGGRPAMEKEYDHPFDYCLGYTLKAFVQRNSVEMAAWAEKFAAECQNKRNANFMGYSQVFNAIIAEDRVAAQNGLSAIVTGHEGESKRGVFRNNVDEALCVWGVGIANLCRRYGLLVHGIPPLIPEELLA